MWVLLCNNYKGQNEMRRLFLPHAVVAIESIIQGTNGRGARRFEGQNSQKVDISFDHCSVL